MWKKHQRRRTTTRDRKAIQSRRNRRPFFEPLEQRLLLTLDALEPNDTFATATDFGEVRGVRSDFFLTVHSNQDGTPNLDFYRFETTATGARSDFLLLDGNPDVELLDANGGFVRAAESLPGRKELSLEDLPAGVYVLKVLGPTSPYSMVLTTPLTADSNEPNESLATATVILQDQTFPSLTMTAGDEDFFKISVPPGATGASNEFASISYSLLGGALNMELQDADGNRIRESTLLPPEAAGANFVNSVSLEGLAAGDYFVRVSGGIGAGDFSSYSMEFEIAPTPDRLESNNSPAAATNVATDQTFNDLSIHVDDQDFYKITVPPGKTGHSREFVEIQFEQSEGNLDLELQDAAGNRVKSSATVTDSERISLEGLVAGDYFVRVFGADASAPRAPTADYHIAFNVPETDMNADPLESNDSRAQATPVPQDVTIDGLSIHSDDDQDFFQVTVPEGTMGTSLEFAEIRFSHREGNLEMELQDAAGNILDSSMGVSDSERVSLGGLEAGNYFVRVYGAETAAGTPSAEAAYEIEFNVHVIAPMADLFEPNEGRSAATEIAGVTNGNTLTRLSIHNDDDQDFFEIIVDAGVTGTSANFVEARFSQREGDLDLELLDANGDQVATSVSASDNERISLEGIETGTYYVRVFGLETSPGSPSATAFYDLAFDLPKSGLAADILEPNNDSSNATEVFQNQTIVGLSIDQATDEDYFSFNVPGGTLGTTADFVEIRFSQSAGNLDLQVQDASGQQVLISQSITDNERISLSGLEAGDYFVRVFGVDSATAPYEIEFVLPQAEFAAASVAVEAGDHLEPNNNTGQATVVRQDATGSDLAIHDGTDQDWFRFTIPDGVVGTDANFVRIDFSHAEGDLDMQLYDRNVTRITKSDSTNDFERISLSSLVAGTYYVKVFGYNSATAAYRIRFDIPEPLASRPDRFDPNNSNNNTRTRATQIRQDDTLSDLTIHSASDEDFFKFTIPADAVGTAANFVEIRFSHAEGDLDLFLQDSNGEQKDKSFTSDDDERLSLQDLEAGTYYVRVDGYEGATARYTIEFNLPKVVPLRPDIYEPNNSLGAARRVAQDDTLRGLTIHNIDDQDYFKFTVPQGATGTNTDFVEIRFSHRSSNLNMRLLDDAGSTLRHAHTGTDNERISLQGLTAGDYYVRVYRSSGGTAPYDIELNLPEVVALRPDRLEGPNGNNTFGSATEVRQSQSLTGLTIQNGDLDYFQIIVPQGATGSVADFAEIRFSHGVADLQMRLYTANRTQIKASRSSTDNERISLEGLAAGTYFVWVYGHAGEQAPYDMTIHLPEATVVYTADNLERRVVAGVTIPNNDSIGLASSIRTAHTLFALSIHDATDEDFYEITLPEGITQTTAHFVRIDFAHNEGNLQLELLRADGSVIHRSIGNTNSEKVTLSGLSGEDGRVFARVYGENGARANYQIAFSFQETGIFRPDESGGLYTLRPDLFEPNEYLETATAMGAIEGIIQTQILRIGHEDWDNFSFRLLDVGALPNRIELKYSASVDLDIRLYDSNGTEVARGGGGPVAGTSYAIDSISLAGRPAGYYTVRVLGYARPYPACGVFSGNCPPYQGNYQLTFDAPYRQSKFNIDVVFPDDSLEPKYQQLILDAAARWEAVITGDLPDIVTDRDQTYTLGQTTYAVPSGTFIDDVRIVVTAVNFPARNDGFVTNAHAGSRHQRSEGSKLSFLGMVEFNTSQLDRMYARGTLIYTTMHEMFHVLTVPFTWANRGLAVDTSCHAQPLSPNPRWVGLNVLQEYKRLTGDDSKASVPLEADKGCGSYGSHLSERIFDRELNTSTSETGPPVPLSRLSVGMLDDLGYRVNYAAADMFTVGAAGEGEDPDFADDLEDDVDIGSGLPPLDPIVVPLEGLFPPDVYERPDPTELLESQTLPELTAHTPGDEDLFMFELMGRGAAEHFLSVSSALSRNLDLELRDAAGNVLSRGLTAGQTLSLAGYAPGTYTVATTSADFNRYDVSFSGQFDAVDPALAAVDIDGDGNVNSTTDYLLVSLVNNGIPENVVEALRAPNATRSGAEIIQLVNHLADALDVDGDGQINTSTDSLMISLAANGIPGNIIAALRAPNALRDGNAITDRVNGLLATAPQGQSEGEASFASELLVLPQSVYAAPHPSHQDGPLTTDALAMSASAPSDSSDLSAVGLPVLVSASAGNELILATDKTDNGLSSSPDQNDESDIRSAYFQSLLQRRPVKGSVPQDAADVLVDVPVEFTDEVDLIFALFDDLESDTRWW